MMMRQRVLWPVAWMMGLMMSVALGQATKPAPAKPPTPPRPALFPQTPLLESFLAGPMEGVDEIVFTVRVPGRDHWYVNFGYYAQDANRRGYGDGGRLCRLNLRTGKLVVLLDDPKGGVRDPQMHYDGRKILFSYRKGGTAHYHLHEIGIDGTGLRQLTDGPFDDFECTYAPDGSIMFVSSRAWRWVQCWSVQVTTLFRCDADGGNIRSVSANVEHDNTPWMLPDGRVLYMRWEYVDRSRVQYHHLWTMNPDGTGQTVYYGNMHSGTVMLDAKPIPGTDRIVSSFSPGHGQPEHVGAITVVDANAGPDERTMTRRISKESDWRDPYAFSEDAFLVANYQGVHLMDGRGRVQTVYQLPPEERARLECHEPVAVMARPRERLIPSRVDLKKATGTVFLADITFGRNMAGVKPGEVKKLLVLETLPKPINFSGTMEPISLGGTFTLERILGTIPVEPDGSAHAELPAMRSLFFVALDANDMSVKRMQSFLTVQPGETVGCLGCHEQRERVSFPELTGRAQLQALRRAPSRIEPIEGIPDVFDFPRDIQPIIDRHCLPCHNSTKTDGQVNLSGDILDEHWSKGYATLMRTPGLISHGNDAQGNRPPRSLGTSASRLMKMIDGSHYDAKLSPAERRMVMYWIESGAVFPGTYGSLGKQSIRFDWPHFKPTEPYVREMKRYGVLPQNFNAASEPIDCYALDRAYWELFWWKPQPGGERMKR